MSLKLTKQTCRRVNNLRLTSLSGFTLLEVMVATVLFALVATTVFGAFSGSVRSLETVKNYTAIKPLTENLLASLGVEIPLRSVSGHDENTHLDWEILVDNANTDAKKPKFPNVELVNVSIRVSASVSEQSSSKTFTLNTTRIRFDDAN